MCIGPVIFEVAICVQHWPIVSRSIMTINRFHNLGFQIFGLVLTHSCRAGSACTGLTLQGFVEDSTCREGIFLVATVLGAIQVLGDVVELTCGLT